MYYTSIAKSSCLKSFVFFFICVVFATTSVAQTVAKFTFTPNNQCGSVPVSFTNASTGAGTLTYVWDFADPYSGANTTSTDVNPVHRFIGPGPNFTVRLTVTSSDGTTATTTQTVTVKNPGIQLGGTGSTTYDNNTYFRICSVSPSGLFTFTNQSTTIATNTSYKIIWGDGSPDFTATTFTTSITHTYAIGTYTLQYIVAGGGCIDTATYYAFVGANPAVGLNNPGNTSICTGSGLTFPITGTTQNPPGTIYTVTFNDNTAPLTFVHPAPNDVSHIFLTTSCGTTSTTYPNSFSATIKATNPCNSSSATVVPIYVSQKPIAAFTVSPRDTACVNSQISFTPTGLSSYNDNGTCTAGKAIWTVSPATGWTIASGSLGNDFGATDPSLWQAGSTNLVLNFSVVGSYTISYKTGNPNCGSDMVSKTICINPTPIGGFTLDNASGCTPLNVVATNTSNTPNCGSNTYAWTVSYSSTGCVPSTSNFSYVNGTSATSANPEFQFINPGTYTINLVTKSSTGTCTAATVSKTVTVKSKPTATITASATVCQNATVSPTATVNNCYGATAATYNWSFPGATPATSTSATPGAIVYNTAGANTITLVVTNECGSTTVTKAITVTQLPDVIVPANQTFCKGYATSVLTFSSTLAGTTYTWTNNNTAIGLGSSGSGNINSFTATNTGSTPITATITVTPVNGCNGTPATFTITVNPTAVAPVVTTPITYCQGNTAAPLTATALGSNTLNWYTVATGGTPNTAAPIPSTAIIGSTNYYVSQSNSYNCESPRATITVTVSAATSIGSATAVNPTSCASATGSIVLNGLTASTSFTLAYTKNGTPVSATVSSNASGIITIANLTSGTYDNIKVTRGTCSSNTLGPYSLVDPNPPTAPTASSNAPLCSGGTLNLKASTTATGTISYTWSGPNGFTSNTQNPTINNITTAGTGNYSVTITIGGCTSAATTLPINIDPIPAGITATSNSPICSGDTIHLAANSTTTGNVTYTWTGPNNFASSLQNPDLPNATALAAGSYNVIAAVGNCAAAVKSTTVAINIKPIISDSSFVNPLSCGTTQGSISLKGLANNTSYVVNYLMNGTPTTVTISSNASGILTIPSLAAGTYSNVTVATAGGCPSNTVGPFVLVVTNVSVTVSATSNSPICSGNSLNLSANTTTAGATFAWTGPNGFTSSSQNPTIANATAAATGTYSVTATSNGCASTPATTSVVVNSIPTGVTATSNSPICSGDTLYLAAASTSTGNITYAWTGPNSFTSNTQNPDIPNITTAATGTYSVIAAIGNCSAIATSLAVTINPKPIITDSSFTNPSTCSNTLGSISLKGLANNTNYIVNFLSNGTPIATSLASNASGVLIIQNLVAGTYSNVSVALAGGCTSNKMGPFVLVNSNISISVSASSNSPICSGTSLNLFANTTTAGATFNWTGPNGFTSSSQNPTIANATITAAGTYSVIATVIGCSSSPATVAVVVASSSIVANAGPAQLLCNATSTTLAANSAGSGTGTWKVIAPSTAAITQINNPTATITNLPIGITKVVWTISNVCQPSTDTLQITNSPSFTNTITPITNAVCNGQTLTLTGNTPTGGSGNYLYQWQQSTDNINFTNISGAVLLNYNATPRVTTYYRRNVVSGGCSINSNSAIISVSASGLPSVFAGNDVTICKGQSTQITATGANSFNWSPTQGLSCTTCASPIASPNFTTNYVVVGDNGLGCTGSDTVTVFVTQPFKLFVSANDTICIGQTAQLLATNAAKYSWNPSIGLNNSTIPNPIASPTFTIPYRVIGYDASNCFSDTGFVVVAVGQYPTVDFGTTGGLVIAGTAVQLQPNITNGPIINYRWTPTQDLSCTNCSNPIATINKDVTYILEAENMYGCKGSDTITYKVTCESSQIFIANVFSPDNDGVNDILTVQGKGISQVKYFRIFNRWGQLVFEKSNFPANDASNGWDGKVNGKPANSEVYVYTAEVVCSAGNTFVYKGNVTLIR